MSKILLAEDKFMYEMHLKQPGFTENTYGPFTKTKKRTQKVKKWGFQDKA